MATTIIVRNVPAETRDELSARAERHGMTLSAYLRAILIDQTRRSHNAELMARVAARVRRMRTRIDPRDVLALIAPEHR